MLRRSTEAAPAPQREYRQWPGLTVPDWICADVSGSASIAAIADFRGRPMQHTPSIAMRAGVAFALLTGMTLARAGSADALPAPAVDVPVAAGRGDQVAYLAGGCYWGVEGVFEHVAGVRQAISGQVADGVETVKLVFDPSVVSYGQLLRVFFAVAHDPTQRDRQGPDVGARYRSEILTTDATQQRVAQAYVDQLLQARAFAAPITTRIQPVRGFRPAADDQQDYARRHPRAPYIVINDAPKIARLQALFPALYRGD
jgi:peptide-methionine (S)-S-oxide reductase